MEQSSVFSQLLRVVGELGSQVRAMNTKLSSPGAVHGLEALADRPAAPLGRSPAAPLNSLDLRVELRELAEQDKRKTSVILRGFNAPDVDCLQQRFDEICQALSVGVIQLENVCEIGSSGLFRAKIPHDLERKRLLDAAKGLKNIESFCNVYVNRDLTYRQRQDLKQRRITLAGGSGGLSRGGDAGEDLAPAGAPVPGVPMSPCRHVASSRGRSFWRGQGGGAGLRSSHRGDAAGMAGFA
jgi:hypothetical protein